MESTTICGVGNFLDCFSITSGNVISLRGDCGARDPAGETQSNVESHEFSIEKKKSAVSVHEKERMARD